VRRWTARIILCLILLTGGAITIVAAHVTRRDTESHLDNPNGPHPRAHEQEPLVSPDGKTVIRMFTLEIGPFGQDTFWLIGPDGAVLFEAYSEDASAQRGAMSWMDNDTIQIPFLADSGDFRTRLLDISPDSLQRLQRQAGPAIADGTLLK
jgi:hypothetical protein